MISSLIYCNALSTCRLPAFNGYQMLAALSKVESKKTGMNTFHHTANVKKDFTISPLLPAAYWHGLENLTSDELKIRMGQCCAFRVTFYDDQRFEYFRSMIDNAELSLDWHKFQVISVSLPGDNDFSRHDTDATLEERTADGVSIQFLTPTGFRNRDTGGQMILPVPEVVFGTLAIRWADYSGSLSEIPPLGINLSKFELASITALLKSRTYARGCVGEAVYDWKKFPESQKKFLTRLAAFSFYSGLGYKTAQGMGQVLPIMIYPKRKKEQSQ